MAEKNVIYMEDVNKAVHTADRKKEIVKNMQLRVREHEFVCIMGPTGCGKSTIMKILCGIESYDDGILLYEDEDTKRGITTEKRKNIGIAYQSDNLFEWRTVYDNVRLPIEMFKLKKEFDVEKRVLEMLELTGLKNYKDCYPKELSGGMRQRCAFARALVHDPGMLFLDQPFGALDAITRKALGAELLKIWHESEKTVVMVTNNVTEALTLGGRVVVLSQAPASVKKVLKVPFSYEERTKNLHDKKEFIELSEELTKLVHSGTV